MPQSKITLFLKLISATSLTFLISLFIVFFYEFSFELGTLTSYGQFVIYDKNGKKIEYFENKVKFKDIPPHLIHAFTAIEDTEFFHHYGFSITSIIRSFWKNLKEKKIVQGGSTITEQYIKLYYGDLRKSFIRKLKNLIISILVEFHHSKEEIFEAYCNLLYFGKNTYGIADASRIFFNKNYKNITLNEAALLAGIVQRPEYFNPIGQENNAVKKKNLVLKRMWQEKHITLDEYKKNIQEKVIIAKNNNLNFFKSIAQSTAYFFATLENSSNREYDIYTTIDERVQKEVSELFNEQINEQKKRVSQIEGAVIVTEYKTGKIIALVNGYDLKQSKNKVFEWKRQIGSIIKPFITYFAFLEGEENNTIYQDSPLEERFLWNPKNFNRVFKGDMTIEHALISSNNIVPIRILDKFNILNFIPLISPFFKNKIHPYLSLALGCIEGSPYEVISLFNAFMFDGEKQNPYFIERIIKKSGGLLYEHDCQKEKIFTNQEAREKTKKILNTIGKSLANRNGITLKETVYAKTGTTNDAVSCWFICANNKHSVAIVIGTDTNKKLFDHGFTSAKDVAPLGLKILRFLETI
jgi:penicillin-binding protein 1A